MAIAFDNAAGKTQAGPTATVTISSFAVTGSNTILIAFVELNSGNDNITTVTFGVTPMTQLTKLQTPGFNEWTYVYYLVGASGTNDIVATQVTDTNAMRAVAASYTGVNQSISWSGGGATDSFTTATANGAMTISASTTPISAGSWLVCDIYNGDTENNAASTNVTQRTIATTQSYFREGDTNGIVSGLTTQTWTSSTTDHMSMIQLSISPPAAAGGTARDARMLSLLGVG